MADGMQLSAYRQSFLARPRPCASRCKADRAIFIEGPRHAAYLGGYLVRGLMQGVWWNWVLPL